MLKAVDLSFQYTGCCEWALRNINLKINKGECLLLAGASGCGKSTLIKAFNGLIPHFEKGVRAGQVLLDGGDIAEIPIHVLALRIGAVFQNPRSQFFTTNTIDEIAFGCENAGFPKDKLIDRVDTAFIRLGITHLKDRSIFSLSNGERQKVILAAIWAMNAEIIVMDEPSANLDPAAVMDLGKIIGELKREGKTIIIAEHRYHYLQSYIDRFVLMKQGHISAIWSATELAEKTNSDLTRMGLRWIHLPSEATASAPYSIASKNNTVSSVSTYDLHFRYQRNFPFILNGINLTADKGEIVALCGANGCGKTSLAMTLVGLLKETYGTVSLGGRQQSVRERIRKSWLVMQETDHQLFTESVYRELELAISNNCNNPTESVKDMIEDLLISLKLQHLQNHHPHSLSGGEKQRLVVAVALAADPELLILDEPTSGLDARSMRHMATLLQNMVSRGRTVLVITHDYEFVLTCCARVLLVKDGCVQSEHLVQKMPQSLMSYLAGMSI